MEQESSVVVPDVHILHEYCEASGWLEQSECSNTTTLSVAFRAPGEGYTFKPTSISRTMKAAIRCVDAPVAFSMASRITANVFDRLSPFQDEVTMQPYGAKIPVVSSLEYVKERAYEIKQCRAVLVREEKIVLLWADSVEAASLSGSEVEHMLMESIWGSTFSTPQIRSYANSMVSLLRPETRDGPSYPRSGSSSNLGTPTFPGFPTFNHPKRASLYSDSKFSEKAPEDLEWEDPEAKVIGHAKRPMILTYSLITGLTLIILISVQGLILSKIITEIRTDGNYVRIAYLLLLPVFAGFAFCSGLLLVSSMFQLFGPVLDNKGNSRYYSANAPNPKRFGDVELPHVTVQIPVYLEGLEGVIIPTVTSIRAAVKHYESMGGTASIFVNDDGMQVVDHATAEARKRYYADNEIGWCSRPPNNQNGFKRRGRFKKASNMNYCLDFSLRVEDEILRLMTEQEQRNQAHPFMTTQEQNGDNPFEVDDDFYEQALHTMLQKDQGRTWANGNIRLGDIILIVDSDTRVPETCLYMGALEMLECPDIAIVQHTSGVLKVGKNIFEAGISYLTDLVYTTSAFNVSSGDCPCFVGHNAFVRWKALQSVSFEEDNVHKFWSESHVSEDLHLSMRLQIAGFEIRMASYHGEEFKEGVSVTVFDEVARWQKYAYGTNELIFNPIRYWYRGPFTSLYVQYLLSGVKPATKISLISYTFTYYALAMALPLALLNYFLFGLWPDTLDQFFVASWKALVVILSIFYVIAPLAYCVIRFRINNRPIQASLLQTLTWTPLIAFFFSGISFHLLKVLVCHFIGVNRQWTATTKENEKVGFVMSLKRIFRDFKWMYLSFFGLTVVVIYLGAFGPYGYRITNWTIILPLAVQLLGHAFLPIALGLFGAMEYDNY